MSESTPQRNKAFVLEAFETLFNRKDFVAAEKFWSPNYIQHSAHIAPGRDGLTLAQITKQESTMASKQSKELVDLFKRMSGDIAADPQMSIADMRELLEHGANATTEPPRC